LRSVIFIFCILIIQQTGAQTIGGSSVFNFLTLPNTPQLTSLGGVNVSVTGDDVGMAFNNPALLNRNMHTRLNAVFNDFYAGISTYHLSFGYHHEKLKTNFAWGVHYFNYGEIMQTDASGNISGIFKPVDWVMQVSASRSYLTKWDYGMTLKYIHSGYGIYRSNGMAADIGVLYKDTAADVSASVLVKNAGFQVKKYEGTDPDEIPFDLQAGITKRLKDAPFSFSLTGQHLHHFDIRYNDTLFNNDNGINGSGKKFTFDKLFRHIVLATQIRIGDNLEFSVGYNHLRRKELNLDNASNGLNGFSLGVAVLLKKIQIRYARAYYQNNTALNQFGINLKLNEYFGLGRFGQKVGW